MRALQIPAGTVKRLRGAFCSVSIDMTQEAGELLGAEFYRVVAAFIDGPKFGIVVGRGSVEVDGKRYDPLRLRLRGERLCLLLRECPSL